MHISSIRPCLTKSSLFLLPLRIGASIRWYGEQRCGGFGIIENGYLIGISGIRGNRASNKSFFNSISRRARRPQWACRIARLWGRRLERDRDNGLEGSACVASSRFVRVRVFVSGKGVRRAKQSLQSETEFLIPTLIFPADSGFVGTEAVCSGWDYMRVFSCELCTYTQVIFMLSINLRCSVFASDFGG